MSSSSYLTLPESERFTGNNFTTFKTILETAIMGRGLLGYLDGSIPKPAASNTTQSAATSTTVTAPDGMTRTVLTDEPSTQWNSSNPFFEEWIQRDAYVCTSILLNSVNPDGLGIKSDGTAAEMWQSILGRYGTKSTIAAINARAALEQMPYIHQSYRQT